MFAKESFILVWDIVSFLRLLRGCFSGRVVWESGA